MDNEDARSYWYIYVLGPWSCGLAALVLWLRHRNDHATKIAQEARAVVLWCVACIVTLAIVGTMSIILAFILFSFDVSMYVILVLANSPSLAYILINCALGLNNWFRLRSARVPFLPGLKKLSSTVEGIGARILKSSRSSSS